jgi:hypothetical protein
MTMTRKEIVERGAETAWRPIPDPTVLTTEQLHREIGALRELFEARLDAGDEAVRLLQQTANKCPTIGEVVSEFREKFRGIDAQFTERDVRAQENKADGKLMVDAAFAAQKEAVAEQNKSFAAATTKSEAATTKQIEATILLVQTTGASFGSKIDDMKERLTLIEGGKNGSHQVWGYVIGVFGMIIAITVALLRR